MEYLSSLNTTEPLDYDNLSIVIHPRPPRRRQSGISLVPFRPYVKCLTGVQQPYEFASGTDKWITIGKKQELFKRENTRCIGSLIEDCDQSDVIRWDIPGESTRLPMMCKLWIIVDGAVVERGKPHLVQDAAIQVFKTGRSLRSILTAQRRLNQLQRSDRRRRHSWYDVNEYHSVPYYQYTRSIRSGNHVGVQCTLDEEFSASQVTILTGMVEEKVGEHKSVRQCEHNAKSTIHSFAYPQHHVQVSITTQTECQSKEKSTETDYQFVKLFNLDLETNENFLSDIANPYVQNHHQHINSDTRIWTRHGVECANRSVSTGDDYPPWWRQLSTNVILSHRITHHGEEKSPALPPISPKIRDQSIQTTQQSKIQIETNYVSSPRSAQPSNSQQSISSSKINVHCETVGAVNGENQSKRSLHFSDHRQDLHAFKVDSRENENSHYSDIQMKTPPGYEHHHVCRTTSSTPSDTSYMTYYATANQPSHSIFDRSATRMLCPCATDLTSHRTRTITSEASSSAALADLLERYQRSLRERQRAAAIINDQLLDIDDIIQRYRHRIQNSDSTICSGVKHTVESNQGRSMLSPPRKAIHSCAVSSCTNVLREDEHRGTPIRINRNKAEEHDSPCSRIPISHSLLNLYPREQPHRSDRDLYLDDQCRRSAWIRYSEQRVDEIQRRFNLLLRIDDDEEEQLLLSPYQIPNRAVQLQNDAHQRKLKRRNRATPYCHRILSPHRYDFHLPYRLQQSWCIRPRLLTRIVTRPAHRTGISTGISPGHNLLLNRTNIHPKMSPLRSASRTTVSILRRTDPSTNLHPCRPVEPSHVWKSDVDGTTFILEQFNIPRYYRLYSDVSFREIYNFSRLLQSYLNNRRISSGDFSMIVKNFALEQQLPTIASMA